MSRDKALRILFKTYWSHTGWKSEYTVSPEDFAFAREAGYMFEPAHLSHADIIKWLQRSFAETRLEHVRNSFLASLSTRHLELRSALGSFAIAKNFPDHEYQGDDFCCSVCGIFTGINRNYDLNILNFERYKWGGVRHEHPEYVAFDLAQLKGLDPIEPTPDDLTILKQIIEVIRRCGPSDKPRDLEKRLQDVLPSNKAEREILIQILGYCGILQANGQPGYFDSFVNYAKRKMPSERTYWTYPVIWWRGNYGVDQDALRYYFPELAWQ